MSSDQSTEQNKSEAPTPFKLKRARERGVVARGTDLGFFATLSALTLFALIAGERTAQTVAQGMRLAFSNLSATDYAPEHLLDTAIGVFAPAVQALVLLGATVVMTVALFETIQVGGILFTARPLKPDFSRLNPAKGLKRLFSARMLKETLKNVVKLALYSACSYIVIRYVFDLASHSARDAAGLAAAMHDGALRLLFACVFVALLVSLVDQVLARGEFMKQMRMSRRELTREIKEREGDPRLKQRRKQLHSEFSKQTRSLGGLKGSDLLVVNPQHYAVSLRYDAASMQAPRVTAKGRNRFALLLKRKAMHLGIPIIERPSLTRSLYRLCDKGAEIHPDYYRAVADLYLERARRNEKAAHA